MPSHRLGLRWLARESADTPAKVVYLISFPGSTPGGGLQGRLDQLLGFRSHHALPIERIEWTNAGGGCWMVTPYTGSADGLLTLGQLLGEKAEGRMDPFEARQAARRLLLALDDSHRHRVAHGPIALDEVLVDRRGGLLIELIGVDAARLGICTPDIRSEVRSVARVAHELLSGLPVGEVERAFRRPAGVSRPWMRWLRRGLDPDSGFASASAALAALPRQ